MYTYQEWLNIIDQKDGSYVRYDKELLRRKRKVDRGILLPKDLLNLTVTEPADYTFWKVIRHINQPQHKMLIFVLETVNVQRTQWKKYFASHLVDLFKPHLADGNTDFENEFRQYFESLYQLELPSEDNYQNKSQQLSVICSH